MRTIYKYKNYVLRIGPNNFFTSWGSERLRLENDLINERLAMNTQKMHEKPCIASFSMYRPTLYYYDSCTSSSIHLYNLQCPFYIQRHLGPHIYVPQRLMTEETACVQKMRPRNVLSVAKNVNLMTKCSPLSVRCNRFSLMQIYIFMQHVDTKLHANYTLFSRINSTQFLRKTEQLYFRFIRLKITI